jgi:HAD superfamily hydrolase (TIGR01490 family)
MKPRLAVFDLDHTLIDGDSDQLWCEFLIDEGQLGRDAFAARNAAMERDYRAGSVSAQAFSAFYIGTLAGRTPVQWQPWCRRFLHERVQPRVRAGSPGLLAQHRARGDLMVLSTATNRVITELTAQALGFEHLIATDCEVGPDGCYTGRARGVLNMREGKVERLHGWLAWRGLALAELHSCFYSDSSNDRPLLEAVDEAVVTHGDARLLALAAERGWRTLTLSQA